MRLGSVGYELGGTEVVKYRSATTLLEFDVVLLDLEEIVDEYSIVEDYDGKPLVTEKDSPRMVADIRRRRGELDALLSLGKTVVVFVPPTLAWYVHTGERRDDGTPGRPRLTRIVDRRGAADMLPFAFETVTAEGTSLVLRAGEPFSTFWRKTSSFFSYRGYVVAPGGVDAAVIAGTDFGAAGIVTQGNGSVILLPDLGEGFWDGTEDAQEEQEEDDLEAAEAALNERTGTLLVALEELVVALAGGDSTLPPWTEGLLLPTEQALLGALANREAAVTTALEAADTAKQEVAALQRDKLLFAGTGGPLRRRVAETFTALGAVVDDSDVGRSDLLVRWDDRVAVVEVKGVAGSAGERDAAQLEKWAASYLEDNGVAPKALLVINAFRDGEELDARIAPAFPAEMRPYAEARGQCLVTSLQLLLMELAVRAGEATGNDVLAVLFDTVGVVDRFADVSHFIENSAAEAAEG